ncbi:hypothetical protein SAMD00019534_099540 [Acytostelium subglobosum LB1]|uniref:hypothetical protein n=1 Tax=Acytostelium subglobosum LB1 TaxID=1410327 RepID=UPI000644D508|nr:hypothetical protein SAMD00019534_099540 [Acytostelium subglobosum LB1]GAM26779.1 hypothetical protein SAMD00019534_099540 [Acytostelium subglobosum LB1]|eukprot:XP_012750440.1 hypothetical protein SAMD00019534_099540 [Acytostelium subglobosum LB1]
MEKNNSISSNSSSESSDQTTPPPPTTHQRTRRAYKSRSKVVVAANSDSTDGSSSANATTTTTEDEEDDEYESTKGEDEEEDEEDEITSPMSPSEIKHYLSDTEPEINPLTGDLEDEDHEVPLISMFQRFLNREAIKSLKHRHSQLNTKLIRLRRKVVDNVNLKEKGQRLKREKDKIKELIKLKKSEFNDKMNAPPFLRLMDKVAFTLGLIVLFTSEFVLIRAPQYMYLLYTALVIPLMVLRFFDYHRSKYHYFMLDFCYLCNFLLLFYMFGHQLLLGPLSTPSFFKLVFALTNGPLAWGCIVWRNSMVFHDVDKLTSVFIHLCPPIVTYCLRWYPIDFPLDNACGGQPCTLSFKDTFVIPIALYVLWQVFYFAKTEIIDETKLANDQDIMTSSRWMSVRQPHPIYKMLLAKNINVSPGAVLMAFQLLYTLGTLITLPLLMTSFVAHTVFLLFIFVMVSWNGACYYFEVFSENYSKRYKSVIGENLQTSSSTSTSSTSTTTSSTTSTSSSSMITCHKLTIKSVYSFTKFFMVFLIALLLFLKFIL